MMSCEDLWSFAAAHLRYNELEVRCDRLAHMPDPVRRFGEAQAIITACEQEWFITGHHPALAAQFAFLATRANRWRTLSDQTRY